MTSKTPFPERRIVDDWLRNNQSIIGNMPDGPHIRFATTLRDYLLAPGQKHAPFADRDEAMAYIRYAAGMISRVGDQVARRIAEGNDPSCYYRREEYTTPREPPILRGNQLVVCHCGSGRKRGWWKAHCAACDCEREIPPKCTLAPSQDEIDAFYQSWEWKRLRYDFIKDRERRCQCCNASAADGVKIVVDHRWPVRRYWDLRLDRSNLQLLCDDCNMGKGSRDTTDWRNGDARVYPLKALGPNHLWWPKVSVSAEEVERMKSWKHGWSREQLAIWGVPWPPPKGWKERLLWWSALRLGQIPKSHQQDAVEAASHAARMAGAGS
jgi:5-methylcytosine-specific restriction endonuclease McrA